MANGFMTECKNEISDITGFVKNNMRDDNSNTKYLKQEYQQDTITNLDNLIVSNQNNNQIVLNPVNYQSSMADTDADAKQNNISDANEEN
jgi:hypothetical protein